MEKFDIYYRALLDYRKSTRENNECARRRKSIARADIDGDVIEIVRTECDIEDDWINAIEEGLEHIGKAIAEERQFILSNGEVVPIEKVKTVSRESVEHLAKHSSLLTKQPEKGEDLIPDKLYTVERLTDYAVYENRFLYMLLVYLKDFITVRYEAISELTSTYSGKMSMHKDFSTGNRQLVYSVNLEEKVRGDDYLRATNSSRDKIDRIDGLLKAVLSYLSHPLMDEVSKAPMLKPPITETNVLKMNRNFKGAMQLYYFITSYTKKGYTYTTTTKRLNPFKEDVADEFAEVAELSSFLTYEYGLGVQDVLKANYEEWLQEERRLAEIKNEERIKSLQKRIREEGVSPEEYMLLLEKKVKKLDELEQKLAVATAEIEDLNAVMEQKDSDIVELQGTISGLNEDIAIKNAEIAQIIAEHEAEIDRLNEDHAAEIEELGDLHKEEIDGIEQKHRKQTEELKKKQAEEIDKIKKSAITDKDQFNSRMKEEKDRYSALEEKLKGKDGELKEAEVERLKLQAQLNAIKQRSGLFTGDEDYTSREGFDELENEYNFVKAQYESLKELFKTQWKKTKKDIRKKYLRADAVTLGKPAKVTTDVPAEEEAAEPDLQQAAEPDNKTPEVPVIAEEAAEPEVLAQDEPEEAVEEVREVLPDDETEEVSDDDTPEDGEDEKYDSYGIYAGQSDEVKEKLQDIGGGFDGEEDREKYEEDEEEKYDADGDGLDGGEDDIEDDIEDDE